MYIRNLKCAHWTPIFRLHNIHLVLSTCLHKYKWILCTEKLVLNASFQDFLCTKMNIHLICLGKKTINTYIKSKKHNTNISSFKYIFIILFGKIRCSNIYCYPIFQAENTKLMKLKFYRFWYSCEPSTQNIIVLSKLGNFKHRWNILIVSGQWGSPSFAVPIIQYNWSTDSLNVLIIQSKEILG